MPRVAAPALRAELFGAAAGRARQLLAQWAIAEVAPGRLLPWLPVAFGFGIVLYFTADREPAWWAACRLGARRASRSPCSRARAGRSAFPLALGLAARRAGFAVATVQTARIAHPVLQYPASSAPLAGFVEMREERERTDRIVVRVAAHRRSAASPSRPQRVRVAVRKGTAPAVGSFVALKAHLSPPLQPLRPGGYDFARDLYFHAHRRLRLCARRDQDRGAAGGAERSGCATRPSSIRSARRSTSASAPCLPGDRGAIASALITGKRDAISAPVNDAMYISSLAHVLSISGYHMAVVAGIVFFFIRAVLALMPVAREPPSDQEMGGARRARRRRASISCCRAPRSRRNAPSS